jgi:hypothetical protein
MVSTTFLHQSLSILGINKTNHPPTPPSYYCELNHIVHQFVTYAYTLKENSFWFIHAIYNIIYLPIHYKSSWVQSFPLLIHDLICHVLFPMDFLSQQEQILEDLKMSCLYSLYENYVRQKAINLFFSLKSWLVWIHTFVIRIANHVCAYVYFLFIQREVLHNRSCNKFLPMIDVWCMTNFWEFSP